MPGFRLLAECLAYRAREGTCSKNVPRVREVIFFCMSLCRLSTRGGAINRRKKFDSNEEHCWTDRN